MANKVIRKIKGTDGVVVDVGSKWENVSGRPETFTPSTSSTAGLGGLVPPPAAGDQNSYLKGDGTWGKPSETGGGLSAEDQALFNKMKLYWNTPTWGDLAHNFASWGALMQKDA